MKRASAMVALIVWVALAGCGGSDKQPPAGGGNPAPPAIATLSPSSVNAGNADLTLTVNGTGFVAGSIVRWAGRDLTTTFASSTQLTARLSSTDLALAG